MTDSTGRSRRTILKVAGGAALVSVSGTAMGAASTQSEAPDSGDYESILGEMAGSGSTSDPYVVTDATELQAVNGDLTAAYTLGDDVDASATSEWNDGAGLDPLGSWEQSFTGDFDGGRYTISGLTIDRTDADYAGLFREVGADGTIERVGLEDAAVTGKRYVGGLVGFNEGSVVGSFTTGEVTSNGPVAGGLVGENFGSVQSSYSTAAVAGERRGRAGLVGTNSGDVSTSYAAGSVDGDGGVVGSNGEDGSVADSYWNTDTIEFVAAGTPGTGLAESEMTGEAAAGNMSALDFESTWRTVTDPADFPQLQWVPEGGATPTEGSNGNGGDGNGGNGNDGSTDGGDDGTSEGSGPGFGVGGAVAAIAGAGYAMQRRLRRADD